MTVKPQHNQTIVRTELNLRVANHNQTDVRPASRIGLNHNQTLVRPVLGINPNHNQALVRR